MTDEERRAEEGEMLRRHERWEELDLRVRRLRKAATVGKELKDAEAEAEEARVHLAELFGDQVEEDAGASGP